MHECYRCVEKMLSLLRNILAVLDVKSGSFFPFQTQAKDKVHSSFSALNAALSAPTGDYLLESVNKLFPEKSSRFKEVSGL